MNLHSLIRRFTVPVCCLFALARVADAEQIKREGLRVAHALQSRYIGASRLIAEDDTATFYGRPMSRGGTPAEAANHWIQEFGPSFTGNPRHFALLRETPLGSGFRTVFAYQQFVEGLPVEYGDLRILTRSGPNGSAVVFAAGRIVEPPAVGFGPLGMDANSARQLVQSRPDYSHLVDWTLPELVVLAPPFGVRAIDPLRVWKFQGSVPIPEIHEAYTFFVDDRTGTLQHVRNDVCNGGVSGQVRGKSTPGVLPDTFSNSAMEVNLTDLTVFESSGPTTNTDRNGSFFLDVTGDGGATIRATLAGPWVIVENAQGSGLQLERQIVPPAIVNFLFNQTPNEFDTAQVNGFLHTVAAHQFYKDRQPAFSGLDVPIICRVNINDNCNAFFTPTPLSINFFRAGACVNTAYSSVVVHEYGHFIVHALGSRQAAFGEGFGDALALLMFDDSVVGRNFGGPGTAVRDIAAANQQYPCFGSIHTCGQVLAGVWLEIKDNLKAALGESVGLDQARQLFTDWSQITLGIARGNNSATPLTAIETLTADDDDGDFRNGTPHAAEICAAFAAHGIPCPGTCDLIRRLRSSCRFGSVVRAALTTSASEGAEFVLTLDGTESRAAQVNRRGRATIRWSGLSLGEHLVCVDGCNVCEAVFCEP